jgi:hypothetical protein
MPIIAKACAKTKAIIIAVNILGALEGFLPKALMLAKLEAAKTAHGPRIHKAKIKTNAMLRLILSGGLLYNCRYFILIHLHYSSSDGKYPLIDNQVSRNQAA